MKAILGFLCVKHVGSCWDNFAEVWPEAILTWRALSLVGTTTQFVVEFYHRNAKQMLNDLMRFLRQDKYTERIKIIQKLRYGARIGVSRKITGVLKAVHLTNSLILGDCLVSEGIEYYPILVPRYPAAKDLMNLVKELSPEKTNVWFKFVRPEDVYILSNIQQLLRELTPAEKRILTTAYELGYFDWPRLHSSKDIARFLNISNTTFLELLRRAEKKILTALYMFIRTT